MQLTVILCWADWWASGGVYTQTGAAQRVRILSGSIAGDSNRRRTPGWKKRLTRKGYSVACWALLQRHALGLRRRFCHDGDIQAGYDLATGRTNCSRELALAKIPGDIRHLSRGQGILGMGDASVRAGVKMLLAPY